MATNVYKKPSRESRPAAVQLQKASLERTLKAIVTARDRGIAPKFVGQARTVRGAFS